MSAAENVTLPGEVTNYFVELRMKLAFRMSLLFMCVFAILSYIYYFDSFESFITMAAGLAVSCVCMAIILFKKSYFLVFYIYSISGVLITGYGLIAFHNTIHLVDLLWMLAGVSLAFFCLGRTLAYSLLLISIAVMVVFVFYSVNKHIEVIQLRTVYQKFSLVVEMVAGFLLNFYLFYLFLDVNRYSERKLMESYEQLKEQNTRILVQNDEKTTLVREVHHHVKNNLQIVVSLLRMQSHEVENPEFRMLFQESINRIMAMSLIHHKLYQNKNLSQIRIGDYLDELVREIMTLSVTGREVQYEIQTEADRIGLKTLVPLGLLVNELVSNSLKHAFDDALQQARIEIRIYKGADGWLDMTYRDNGSWKAVAESGNSFGLILIDALVEQLDGSKEVRKEAEGTTYCFRVKNLEERDVWA